jgi:hypothetical protein
VALMPSEKFPAGELVTGVVMAVLGHETVSGEFEVEDVCFHMPGPQPQLPADAPDDVYVALISGLCIGESTGDTMLPLQMFIDYVSGELGSVGEQVSSPNPLVLSIWSCSCHISTTSHLSFATSWGGSGTGTCRQDCTRGHRWQRYRVGGA